jgi:4-carboxymuconolactone decarboxylase
LNGGPASKSRNNEAQGQNIMSEKRETGRAILREVIGEAYFEKREQGTNAFNQTARRLSEEFCFGEIWARPGLDRKTRSLLCIVMMIALNRNTELRLHIEGAINNGATAAEIEEAVLQSIIYCDLPAGLEGMRAAEDVLSGRGLLPK